MDYRARILERYTTLMRQRSQFDSAAATRWGIGYSYYLRGWWPARPDSPSVDVGCGDAWLLHLLKSKNFQNLHGVDLSAEQVAIARTVVPSVDLGDGTSYLKSRPNTFEWISAVDVIEHLTKNEGLDFLDAAFGALKPGGRLVLQTPNCAVAGGLALRYADFTHEVGFTPTMLGKLLGLCGFQDYSARELDPVPLGYSLISTARWVMWRWVRLSRRLTNLVEIGNMGEAVQTPVFLATAIRP